MVQEFVYSGGVVRIQNASANATWANQTWKWTAIQ